MQRFFVRSHHLLVIAQFFLIVSQLHFDQIVSKWKLDLVFWLHLNGPFLPRFIQTILNELLTATFIIVIGVHLDDVNIYHLLWLGPLICLLLLVLQVCSLQLLRLLSDIVIIIAPLYLYVNGRRLKIHIRLFLFLRLLLLF